MSPWERIVPRPHRCTMPIVIQWAGSGIAYGSIWRCDSCGKRWEYARGGFIAIPERPAPTLEPVIDLSEPS